MLTVILDPTTSATLASAVAVGDPSSTRTVYITTFALLALSIGLAVLTWWLLRRTRPDPELFAPLEEMESRAWRKMSADERREALEASRPIVARPFRREEWPADDDPDDESVDAASDEHSAEDSDDSPEEAPATNSDELADATPHQASAIGLDEVEDADAEVAVDGSEDGSAAEDREEAVDKRSQGAVGASADDSVEAALIGPSADRADTTPDIDANEGAEEVAVEPADEVDQEAGDETPYNAPRPTDPAVPG